MSNYRINEFAKRVGRSVQTIRRSEREGKLTAKRLPSGHRYFDASEMRSLMGGTPDKKDIVVYCSVSGAGQKDDLASQVAAMQAYYLADAIVHTFSCRLDGMRKYKQVIKEDFPQFQLGVVKDELQ